MLRYSETSLSQWNGSGLYRPDILLGECSEWDHPVVITLGNRSLPIPMMSYCTIWHESFLPEYPSPFVSAEWIRIISTGDFAWRMLRMGPSGCHHTREGSLPTFEDLLSSDSAREVDKPVNTRGILTTDEDIAFRGILASSHYWLPWVVDTFEDDPRKQVMSNYKSMMAFPSLCLELNETRHVEKSSNLPVLPTQMQPPTQKLLLPTTRPRKPLPSKYDISWTTPA